MSRFFDHFEKGFPTVFHELHPFVDPLDEWLDFCVNYLGLVFDFQWKSIYTN